MHWLRCVLAEWQLLRARLVRSRLGLWLLLLGGGGVWLGTRGAPLTILAPHLAMLGAVLGVAFSVGSDVDRAAVTAAGILLLAFLCVAAALTSLPAGPLLRAGGAALGAAAAAAGCALVAAARGGNALTGALFLYIAVPSVVSADTLGAVLAPGALTRISVVVLELLPGVWRYEALAGGDPVGWAHAACWVVGGIAGTAQLFTRRAV